MFTALGLAQVAGCGGQAAGTHAEERDTGGGSGSQAGSGGGDGGSAGSVAGSVATVAGAGGRSVVLGCISPTPRVPGQDTGFESCDNGFIHRATQGTCPSSLPRVGLQPASPQPTLDRCQQDSDCSEHPYGYCYWQPGTQALICHYGCIVDADCNSGELCDCASALADPQIGQCVPAGCVTDADCADGLLCVGAVPSAQLGCGPFGYSCQTANDTCASSSDCVSGICTVQVNGSHACGSACSAGRPFLVSGQARLARVTTRTDWCLGIGLLPGVLTGVSSACELAESWTDIALMEHASIAAFARFTLQLMSLGAPPDLIEAATAAISDETRHAQMAFGLAQAFGAEARGPGPLSLTDSLTESSLIDIVLNAFREGCVGETQAALEAREAAEQAEHPAIRAALRQISEDETRHAELAWRFVRWALEGGDEALRVAVANELAELRRQSALADSPALTERDQDLLRGGIVPSAIRRVLHREALERVILPAAEALLKGAAGAQAERRGQSPRVSSSAGPGREMLVL